MRITKQDSSVEEKPSFFKRVITGELKENLTKEQRTSLSSLFVVTSVSLGLILGGLTFAVALTLSVKTVGIGILLLPIPCIIVAFAIGALVTLAAAAIYEAQNSNQTGKQEAQLSNFVVSS